MEERETEVAQSLEPFVLFQVADATYAVHSDQVRWLEMIEHITRVPNAPAYVDGVVYTRGRVIPVINLRQRLGYPPAPYTARARLIIVELDGRLVGMAVDSAREFIYLPQEQIQPPPEIVEGVSTRYLEGVFTDEERLILVLNLPELLSKDERAELVASPWLPSDALERGDEAQGADQDADRSRLMHANGD